MNDDRVRRILEVAEQPLSPAPEFASALLGDLRAELGFEHRSRASVPIAGVRGHRRSPRLGLLLVAAVVLGSALGLLSVAARREERLPTPTADALAGIRAAGRIRIAIRPDHPQFSIAGQPAIGFDKDVAEAIATRLGVQAAIVVVDADAMLGGETATWDIALPSTPSWSIDGRAFEVTSPYYFWGHRIIVQDASGATSVADIRGEPICAVDGDAGAAWLRGSYGPTQEPPITTSVVSRATDAECITALEAGEVAATVTATMSDADIRVRSGIRMLDGPDAEPRAVIVPRPPGATSPSALTDAVGTAIAALQADGTLTRLSQSRFGGDDLTRP